MRRVVRVFGWLAVACGLWLASESWLSAADKVSSAAIDPGVLFDKLDADHSGVLTAEKIPADKRELFERLLRLAGKPSDGQLNRAEFVAQLKSITEPPASSVGSGGSTGSNSTAGTGTAKSAGAPAVANPKKQPDPAKMFDRFDKNHTGKLTIDDVPEQRQRLFKRLLKIAGKSEGSSLTKDEFVNAFDIVLAKRAAAAKPAN